MVMLGAVVIIGNSKEILVRAVRFGPDRASTARLKAKLAQPPAVVQEP
jgi:hypothetical protein